MRLRQLAPPKSCLRGQTEPGYPRSRSQASLAPFDAPPSSGEGPVAPASLPCSGRPRSLAGPAGDAVDRTRSEEVAEVERERTLCLRQSYPTR